MKLNKKIIKRSLWIFVLAIAFPVASILVLSGFFQAGWFGFKQHWRNHRCSFQNKTFIETYFELKPIKSFLDDDWWNGVKKPND